MKKRCNLASLIATLLALPAFGQPYQVEQAMVESGDIVLGASVYVPDDCGPCPAAVLIGGGSATTRDRQVPFADQFARAGIVSIVYDKRGTGESTGNYENRTFDEMVADALAAFAHLQGHESVDLDRVGLWGASEGGTLALIAASREPAVGFVLNLAGPVDVLRSGQLLRRERAGREAGLEEATVSALVSAWDRYYEDALDDDISDSTLTMIRELRSGGLDGWLPAAETRFPPEDQPDVRSFWYLHRISALPRLAMSVLFVYGGADEFVDAGRNVGVVEWASARSGRDNYDALVLEGASHAFTNSDGMLVPRFFESQIEWMLAR